MGLWDFFTGWFTSNKDKFSKDQQEEIENLLHKLKTELQDNINSASSNTTRRLESVMHTQTRRMYSEINDSKDFNSNEMKRMSKELEEMRNKLDEEDEKKKKEKKESDDKNFSTEYTFMLEMMKNLMTQNERILTAGNYGYPQKAYGIQWPLEPVYYPPPGSPSVPFPSQPGFSQRTQYTCQQGYGPPNSNTNDPNKLRNFSEKIILPDSHDYKKCGVSCKEKGFLNSPKKFDSPEKSTPPKSRFSGEHKPKTKDERRSSLDGFRSYSAQRLILPDKRYYKYTDGLNSSLKMSPDKKSSFGRRMPTSKSPINLKKQFGCDLILPDSRDYNIICSSAIQKKIGDEEFEKMTDDSWGDFCPASKSEIKNLEKQIANGVKNFFLENQNKKRVPEVSPNASVSEWLTKNETCLQDDDGKKSDSSGVSVKTDVSKCSTMSTTSGKRVFWNKSKNYEKPAHSSNLSVRSEPNRNKPFEKSNKNFKRYNNPNQYKKRGARNSDGYFSSNSVKEFKSAEPANQKARDSNASVGSAKTDSASKSGNTASDGGISQISSPSREEADQNNIDPNLLLSRKLLFLGKNEDEEWITHQPKCLNEIYALKKKYKIFKMIEIS